MDPEMRQKVFELLEVTKENNVMLRKIRNIQKWQTGLRIFYWFILIGIALGAFYFLQPYVAQIKSFGESLPNAAYIQALFNQSQEK